MMEATSTRPPAPARYGFWHRRIHPKLLDLGMNTAETRTIRQRVCAPLTGVLLEIGFGTGHNVPFLPDTVTKLLAVDPLTHGWKLAAARISRHGVDAELVGTDARVVGLADRSVDAVLCTWSLCSIPDPRSAVAEAARVLRPGGRFHFVEHGNSPEPSVSRRQRRLDPLWSRLSCGCHLDRHIPAIIEAGGLRIERLDTYYTDSEPRMLGWTFEGFASTPSVV